MLRESTLFACDCSVTVLLRRGNIQTVLGEISIECPSDSHKSCCLSLVDMPPFDSLTSSLMNKLDITLASRVSRLFQSVVL